MGSGPTGGVLGAPPPSDLLQYCQFKQPTMSYAQINAANLSANQARGAICDLADQYSWETVAREMLSRLSGDEAREFVEDFQSLYAD